MADDTTQGFGQQDPSASVGGFNPHAFSIAQALARLATIKIVKVIAVDTTAHTVDVQIAVNQLDGQNNSTPHGTIYGIPYAWAMGGKNAFQIDPAVDDLGVMVISDRDISAVKNTKDIANPGSLRKLSPSDGVYLFSIPGLNGTAPEQWIKWTADGIDIAAAHGNALISNANGWFFTGPVTMNGALQLGGALTAAGGGELAIDIKTTGDVVAGTISLKTHKHTGVTTGGGTSGPPTP